jgi:hypothetical protein
VIGYRKALFTEGNALAVRYEVTRTIEADPERIWSLLTNADSYDEWNPAVVSLAGKIALGETISLVSIADPKRTFKLTVTGFDRPHRMVWSDGMPLGLFRGVRTYTLTPQDGGATVFHMQEVFSGVLAPLITRAIPDLTDSFAQFADGLKRGAEGGVG